MSGPSRESGHNPHQGQGQNQNQGYPPPPLPRSSLPSFPLPSLDPHSHHHQPPQIQSRQSQYDEVPPTAVAGLQSFAASPEEWDEGEVPGSPGKWKSVVGYDRKPVATRRRVVQSCSECRRRKIKCDKKFPCGPCILREDQDKCHEVGMAEKHIVASTTHHATTAELATVAHRLDALEAALIKNRCILPADIDNYMKSTLSMYTSEDPSSSTRRRDTTVPSSGAIAGPSQHGGAPELDSGHNIDPKVDDDTEDAALTIEHLTFGRSRVVGGHSMAYFGASHPSSIGRREPNNDYHLARTSHSSPIGHASALHAHSNVRGGSGSPGSRPGPGPGQQPRKSSLNVQLKTIKSEREPTNLPTKRFADTLSHEEKMARMDALLDIMEPTDLIDMFWKKTDVAMRYLMMIFPDPEKGRFLVNAFVEKVDWLHRCIHIPSFLRQCNDLWNLPAEKVLDEIAMPFIALYVTVCTLGLSFSDSADIAKYFNPEEVPKLVDQWYSGVRAAMWASDMMGEHVIEHCQSLLLLSVLMNNRDRAEAAWALLGSTIKMAQNLGMSRLGAEQQAENGKPLSTWTGRWESLIQREVGRRIWWNLVFLEWSLAPSYSFSTSITPDQIKTALPANIEDEDLIDGEPLRAKPLNVRTRMSYQLARLSFSEQAYKQIWQANNGGSPPYSWVLEMDGEFRRKMLELPPFFQPSPSSEKVPPYSDPKAMVEYYEKTTLNLGLHSRMMRLHRPWLSRGYDDERFAYSKEQCIRAARAGLRLMCGGENNHVAQFLEKWWIPLFHVSVSAMVVIIDLLRTNKRDMHSSETERKIEEVKGSLDNMRLIKDVSPSAKATVRVMDFLLAEVEERRRPTNPGKRKATSPVPESDDGLQRAVKKLIRQAQLEADSPTNSGITTSGNSGTPGAEHGAGAQPSLSRSSSRERPVFDAYPMPQIPIPAGQGLADAGAGGGKGKTGANVNQAQGQGAGGPMAPPRNGGAVMSDFYAGNSIGGPPQISNQNGNQNAQSNLLFPPTQTENLNQNQNQNLNPFENNQNMFNFIPSPYSYQFPTDPTLHFPQILPNQGQPLDPAVESMLASYFPQQDLNTNNGGGGQVPGGVGPEDFLSRVFSFGWNDAGNSNGGGDAQQQGGGQGQGQGMGMGDGSGNGNGNGGGQGGGGFGFGDNAWIGGGGGWMA